MVTRRQWLLASLSTALAACRGSRPPEIPGGFIGPDPARGHLVKTPEDAFAAPASTSRTEVAILGGGIAGLSAAWALRRAGFEDFVVLELEDTPGGTSSFREGPVVPHPLGAHYVPVPRRDMAAACALFEELGVITGYDAAGRARCAEEHLLRAPQERIFYKGRWYEGLYLRAGASAEDLRQLARFNEEVGRWVRAREGAGRRAFTLPSRLCGRGPSLELDHLSAAAWLDRLGLTSPRLRWQVDYACRDDFGLDAAHTSAWAAVHYFAARLIHPDDRPPEVLTWPEGNGYLVRRLAAPLGERLRTGCVVTSVRPQPGAPPSIEVRYRALTPGEARPVLRAISARQVIFALPAFLRPYLIAEPGGTREPFLDRFTYSPWLVANLTLRRPPPPPVANGSYAAKQARPGFPLCWDNVLVESPSLGYVVATHQREPPPPPDGVPRSVYTYYLPLTGADVAAERRRLLVTPHAAWCQVILADLSRAEPGLAADLERVDLCRFGHGMVRPVPGTFSGDALARAALPLGGVHFAHSDLGGMALFEEAQDAGVQAAQAVMRARGHKFEAL